VTGRAPALASIIIPAYNAEQWLERAIRSALQQTWRDREIIVVDDGSTDGTREACSAFGEAIRYLRRENGGPSAARNAGLEVSRGEFIAFLDADDELLPGMLGSLVRALEASPQASAASGAHLLVTPRGTSRRPRPRAVPSGVVPDFFAAYREHVIVWTGSAVFRRAVFLDLGGFRANMRSGEDMELWSRIAGRHPWVFVDEEVARYYLDPKSSSTLGSSAPLPSVDWIYPEAEMRGRIRPELWASYRRFRRDWTLDRARALMARGETGRARTAIARIAPAGPSALWATEWLLARAPARAAAAAMRILAQVKQGLRWVRAHAPAGRAPKRG
jgi:glycosyltransferase involved in cell wall biosynthesis